MNKLLEINKASKVKENKLESSSSRGWRMDQSLLLQVSLLITQALSLTITLFYNEI